MKFNIKIYIPVTTLGLSLLLSGCGDSFLEKSPSDYITSGDLQEVAKWNSNILMGQALGTYSTTFAMNSGGTGGHDDFGQKSVDIATDLMSGDMVIMSQGYGWFEAAGSWKLPANYCHKYNIFFYFPVCSHFRLPLSQTLIVFHHNLQQVQYSSPISHFLK